jgi:hypothetical protein
LTANYQPFNDEFLCEAKELLTILNVLCESMIYTHSTKPITITHALCEPSLRLTKAAQKYHAQQDGFVKGSQSMITNCSPLTNPLGMVWISRFIKVIKHNERNIK